MTSPESPAVQDMDRLRVLATILAKDRAARWRYTDTLNPAELARFVQREASDPNLLADLGALLPVHRAMVLREATAGLPALPESLICDAIINPSVFLGYARGGESYPAWAARAVVVALQGFAASTPPGAPGSPQTAERATPAETGGRSGHSSRPPRRRPMADEKLAEELARFLADDEADIFTDPKYAGAHWDNDRELHHLEARRVLEWLAERGRLVPDRPGGVVKDCGCPITYEVAKIENHTYECGQRQAAERLARHIAEEYGNG